MAVKIYSSHGKRVAPDGTVTEAEFREGENHPDISGDENSLFEINRFYNPSTPQGPSAAINQSIIVDQEETLLTWDHLQNDIAQSDGSYDAADAAEKMLEISGGAYIEYQVDGRNIGERLTPDLIEKIRNGEITSATLYDADPYSIGDTDHPLKITIEDGKAISAGDGMEDDIPQAVLDFAAEQAAEKGIPLTVQVVKNIEGTPRTRSTDYEYRLLDDNGNEVEINLHYDARTDQVVKIDGSDSVVLPTGSELLNKVMEEHGGHKITNPARVEETGTLDWKYEHPENYPELAQLMERVAMEVHGQISNLQDTNSLELQQAQAKFLEEMQKVQAGGDPAALTQALEEFRQEYGAHVEEGKILFDGQMDDLQDKINEFYISNKIVPPNLLSPEREAYELEQALIRQVKKEETLDGSSWDERSLIEAYKDHYEASTSNPERFTPNVDGRDIDFPGIYAPGIKDIQGWPPERMGELTDEQISHISRETLSKMAAAIDEDYQKYATDREAEQAAAEPDKTQAAPASTPPTIQ